MKRSDDYESKYAIWAAEPAVFPLPEYEGVPRFAPRRFGSYEGLNRWKRELLLEIARRGGLRWTR
jgi:hypothetical protein